MSLTLTEYLFWPQAKSRLFLQNNYISLPLHIHIQRQTHNFHTYIHVHIYPCNVSHKFSIFNHKNKLLRLKTHLKYKAIPDVFSEEPIIIENPQVSLYIQGIG